MWLDTLNVWPMEPSVLVTMATNANQQSSLPLTCKGRSLLSCRITCFYTSDIFTKFDGGNLQQKCSIGQSLDDTCNLYLFQLCFCNPSVRCQWNIFHSQSVLSNSDLRNQCVLNRTVRKWFLGRIFAFHSSHVAMVCAALTHWGWEQIDDIFKCIFLNENVWISIKISSKFVPKGSINNIPALVQIMAWCRPGDKPLSEPMMVNLPTHIWVSQPQWVKEYNELQLVQYQHCHYIWITRKKIVVNGYHFHSSVCFCVSLVVFDWNYSCFDGTHCIRITIVCVLYSFTCSCCACLSSF